MLRQYSQLMGFFVVFGIIQELLSYAPRLTFNFFLSKKDGKRRPILTINGRPLFLIKRKEDYIIIDRKENLPTPSDGDDYIVAIIPAWNEELDIPKTIKSIQAQTRKPDLILVIPNNTTDKTARVSREEGAEVLDMPGFNPDKKAGAINFALTALEPRLDRHQRSAILIMDADTVVSSDFIEVASKVLFSDPSIGGVGSIFTGRPSKTLVGLFQQMEYHRYAYQVNKRPEAFVLSGTASLFNWEAFKEVKRRRLAGLLSGGKSYYDTESLTEDNEITFAILACGFYTPTVNVTSVTDVMDDTKSLYKQRKRWYVGALQNISHYGLSMPAWMRLTYWRQQIGLGFSLIIMPAMMVGFVAWALTGFQSRGSSFAVVDFILLPIYIGLKIFTVRKLGLKAMIVAGLFVPEIYYSNLLVSFFAISLYKFLRGDDGGWTHT